MDTGGDNNRLARNLNDLPRDPNRRTRDVDASSNNNSLTTDADRLTRDRRGKSTYDGYGFTRDLGFTEFIRKLTLRRITSPKIKTSLIYIKVPHNKL